ncbi:MFS transporter [Marinobacter daqiaonensis]|uniref:MFS transporter n=1 Tax=Marinobacter daqiaonensis TaxID=650891 RepID=UPI001D11A801|nr:MFS transporter [Marinobacter daqiaonensis]
MIIIVMAQFFGTSLWFTPNAVMPGLMASWGVGPAEVARLTGAVQLGFILGTLIFAISGLADRWRASRIFLVCALAGAVTNGLFVLSPGAGAGLIWRFLTGLCLAGIYPIGMKLVASWAPEKKGLALGWLVGMLTLGTAFPHLMRGLSTGWNWQPVVLSSSVLAVVAGLMVARLGDGPSLPASGHFNWGGVVRSFRSPRFRAAALGYFGHMWELYAVWALAPLLVAASLPGKDGDPALISLASFLFIASGAVGCVLGGMVSRRIGSARVAFIALSVSGLMCLLWPWLGSAPAWLSMLLLMVWGMAVIADSPQFSALAAESAPSESVGSSLAIMNSVGFLLTVFAIELTARLWLSLGTGVTWLLVIGPVLGLMALRPVCR